MSNPYLEQTLAVATSIAALKLKGARIVGTAAGAEIHQRGKPTLLLTYEAAREFAALVSEAEHG